MFLTFRKKPSSKTIGDCLHHIKYWSLTGHFLRSGGPQVAHGPRLGNLRMTIYCKSRPTKDTPAAALPSQHHHPSTTRQTRKTKSYDISTDLRNERLLRERDDRICDLLFDIQLDTAVPVRLSRHVTRYEVQPTVVPLALILAETTPPRKSFLFWNNKNWNWLISVAAPQGRPEGGPCPPKECLAPTAPSLVAYA